MISTGSSTTERVSSMIYPRLKTFMSEGYRQAALIVECSSKALDSKFYSLSLLTEEQENALRVAVSEINHACFETEQREKARAILDVEREQLQNSLRFANKKIRVYQAALALELGVSARDGEDIEYTLARAFDIAHRPSNEVMPLTL